jgi:hypothetical protein
MQGRRWQIYLSSSGTSSPTSAASRLLSARSCMAQSTAQRAAPVRKRAVQLTFSRAASSTETLASRNATFFFSDSSSSASDKLPPMRAPLTPFVALAKKFIWPTTGQRYQCTKTAAYRPAG